MDFRTIRRCECVTVRRGGVEVEISLTELRTDDVFKYSGAWWQLCTSRQSFEQVEPGVPFLRQHKWYAADRDGNLPRVRTINPNVPFGEPSRLSVPLPFLITATVDVLDLKLAA